RDHQCVRDDPQRAHVPGLLDSHPGPWPPAGIGVASQFLPCAAGRACPRLDRGYYGRARAGRMPEHSVHNGVYDMRRDAAEQRAKGRMKRKRTAGILIIPMCCGLIACTPNAASPANKAELSPKQTEMRGTALPTLARML